MSHELFLPDSASAEGGFSYPANPVGRLRLPSGLLVPAETGVPSTILEPTPEELVLYSSAPENSETYLYEGYLFLDPAMGLNRLVTDFELATIRETVGDFQQYSDFSSLIKLFDGECNRDRLKKFKEEFYELLSTINNRVPLESLAEGGVWDYLGVLADYVLIQSDMKEIPVNNEIVELLSKRLTLEAEVPEKMLDFIANFEIPSELASRLMDRIADNSNHPIYWWVASRCPDHPEVIRQREAAKKIIDSSDAQDSISHADFVKNMLPLGVLLPEDLEWPTTGIELEGVCYVSRVKIPQGTHMGYDAVGTSMLELRLNHQEEIKVLDYGSEWLKRYFEKWRWKKVSHHVSASVHFHSGGNDLIRMIFAHQLFGEDYNDCRPNNLGTVEVRTALSGYLDSTLKGRGYPGLPHPAFIELIHACAGADAMGSLLAARLGETDWHARVKDVQSSMDSIEVFLRGKRINLTLEGAFRHFDYLDTESHVKFFEAFKSSSPQVLTALVGNLYEVNLALQEKVILEALKSDDPQVIIALVWNLYEVNLALQEKVILEALKSDDPQVIIALVRNSHNVDWTQRGEIIAKALKSDDPQVLTVLVVNLHDADSAQREEIVTKAFKLGDPQVIAALAGRLRNVDWTQREEVVTKALKSDDSQVLTALVRTLRNFNSALQEKIITKTLKSGDSQTLFKLAQILEEMPLNPIFKEAAIEARKKTRGRYSADSYNNGRV